MLINKKVKWFGHHMYLDPQDKIISKYLDEKREWEKYEGEMLIRGKFIKKGDVVIDVGAHTGYYTLIFAKLVGEKGKVFAFEPDARNFKFLKRNIGLNGYQSIVTPMQKAISSIKGKVKFYQHPTASGGHTLRTRHEWKVVQVNVTTLNNWYESYKGKVDFIKMDIEGYEYLAFCRMSKILEANEKIKIFTEFTPRFIEKTGEDNARRYLEGFFKRGFRVWYVHNREFGLTHVNWRGIRDIIAIRDGAKRRIFTNLLCIRS